MEKPEEVAETQDTRHTVDVERQPMEKGDAETKPEPEAIDSKSEQVIDVGDAKSAEDTNASPAETVDAKAAESGQQASDAAHETTDSTTSKIEDASDHELLEADSADDVAPLQPVDDRLDVVEADPTLDKAETVIAEIEVDADPGEVTPDVAPPAFDSQGSKASTDEQQGEDTFSDPRVATEDDDSSWDKDWPKGPPDDADPPPPDDPSEATSQPADTGIEIGEAEALAFSPPGDLINPSEPGGDDFDDARVDVTDLGDGIADARTINPAPHDAEPAPNDDTAGDASIGSGVVDPVNFDPLGVEVLDADRLSISNEQIAQTVAETHAETIDPTSLDGAPMRADDLAQLDKLAGIDNLDVFDILGPVSGGGVPGSELGGMVQGGGVPGSELGDMAPGGGVPGNELDGLGFGGFDAGAGFGLDAFGFDASGFNDPFSSHGFDLGSIGLGGDIRTGYDGQQPNDSGGFGGQGFGSQSGSSGTDTGYSGPGGAQRESFGDFGSSPSGTNDNGGSWTGITSFSDYSDGNVIEQETSHEPAGGGNDSGSGSDSSGGQDSSSGDGSDGSGDSGSTQDTADKGDAADSQPNPYADEYYNLDVDVSLKFSNDGLTNPVEPGGDDLRFGAERLQSFGNGIYDPRTINPAPDGDTTGGSGGSAGGGVPNPGVVDPVGPGLFAGGLTFGGGLMQADGDDSTMTDQNGFDDFDPFFG